MREVLIIITYFTLSPELAWLKIHTLGLTPTSLLPLCSSNWFHFQLLTVWPFEIPHINESTWLLSLWVPLVSYSTASSKSIHLVRVVVFRCVYTHVHIYLHVHIHVHVHIHMHARARAHTDTHTPHFLHASVYGIQLVPTCWHCEHVVQLSFWQTDLTLSIFSRNTGSWDICVLITVSWFSVVLAVEHRPLLTLEEAFPLRLSSSPSVLFLIVWGTSILCLTVAVLVRDLFISTFVFLTVTILTGILWYLFGLLIFISLVSSDMKQFAYICWTQRDTLHCHDIADVQCSQRSIPCALVSGLAHWAGAGSYTQLILIQQFVA